MGGLLLFLFQATAISLSGVMAPGPMTAAAIAAGARRKHAGALMALGHGMVEFPLMVGIMAGMGVLLTSEAAKAGIGLAGGVFLVLMGAGMLWKLREPETAAEMSGRGGPIIVGVILSVGNPFFLIWWATVGLTLATKALELGVLAFALFAAVHWLCDLVWLEALSAASFRGGRLLGGRSRRIALAVCALVLLAFGVIYLCDAGRGLAGLRKAL